MPMGDKLFEKVVSGNGVRYHFELRRYLDEERGIYLRAFALNKRNSTIGSLHIPKADLDIALPAFIEVLRAVQDF